MMMTAMINMMVMAGGDSLDVVAAVDADADVDGGEWR